MQKNNSKQTSTKVASTAAKLLNNPKTTAPVKRVAASALAQTTSKKK